MEEVRKLKEKNSNSRQQFIQESGTVTFVELEGGFHGIITEDGQRYLPLNLPDQYKKNGLKVTFRARHAEVMTIQQWGTPIEIVEIKEKHP